MPKRPSRPLRRTVRAALYAARYRRRRPLPPLPQAVIDAVLADGWPAPEDWTGRLPPLPADPEIYRILI